MSKRKMPTKKVVKKYWSDYLIQLGKFDSKKEILEADYCWGCGFKAETERCHIKAKTNGGSDKPENIHLLCKACHKLSEFKEGKKYSNWFEESSILDLPLIKGKDFL